jgi:hypothetical protein
MSFGKQFEKRRKLRNNKRLKKRKKKCYTYLDTLQISYVILCQKKMWNSAGGKGGPLIFTSIITLHLPFSGEIKLPGDGRADKKSAQDSAALALLYELQRLRLCQVDVAQAS